MNKREINEALKGLWEWQDLERAKGMVRSMECMKETDTTLYRITKFFVEQAEKTEQLKKHGIPALRDLAVQRCKKSNCGSVCLCGPCHARKALETLDPEWRP